MNLTTPNLLMLGVVAIGGFAAYRMFLTKKEDQLLPESDDALPRDLAMLGDPLKLTQNRWYRGRIRLREAGMPPFIASASLSEVAQGLTLLGFSNVEVFDSIERLPYGWPKSTTGNSGKNTRWFNAKWPGVSAIVPRPPDVEAMWITSPPKPATSGYEVFEYGVG